MYIDPKTVDIWLVQNNGVVAMRPNPSGRFGGMAETIQFRTDHKAWVFKNAQIFDGRPNACDLRTSHGSLQELKELKTWMETRGITWANYGDTGSSRVPFSNGAHKVISRRDDGVASDNDYDDFEYAYRRDDCPRMAIEAFLNCLIAG